MEKGNFKRLLSFLLVLATAAVLCPAAPAAQAEDVALCPCCGKTISSIIWTEYDKWDNFFGSVNFSNAGPYRITEAFTMKKEFSVSKKVTIDFNGYLLKAASGKRGFTVKNAGTLTFINTGGENGRLTGQNTSGDGGAIKVEAGGTLNIAGGRIIGASTTGMGGTIYNAGIVNITGGSVESGKSTNNHGGNIYNAGTLNITGGSVEAGVVKGNDYFGGNIYNAGTLDMSGGILLEGTAWDHGGNLYLADGSTTHIHGGSVESGKSTNNNGGNIFVTGATTVLNIYDGTITGGTAPEGNGGNLRPNGGAQVYMYGGTIENGSATNGHNVYILGSATPEGGTKQYSALYILGGTITATATDGDLYKYSTGNIIKMYGCRYIGSQDVTGFIADCSCYNTDDTGITIWNSGYFYGCSNDTCIFDQAMEDELVELVTGNHTYAQDGNIYTCTVCGYSFQADSIAATVSGHYCTSLEAAVAMANAGAGTVVQLHQDAVVSELAISGYTLDLNGYTLMATEAFSSTGSGNVIDTSDFSVGKLVCDSVTLAEENTYLPITKDDGLHFAQVGFTQWIEPLAEDTTKVKFYFTQRAKDTIIDDVIKSGSTEIDVQLHLAWTDKNGKPRSKTVVFGNELLQKYVQKWDNRVFVATITGTSDVTDLCCTWQVTSTAKTGTKTSAQTIKSSGYINEKLSWEAINSYPIKTEDMTVEEMRQLCLDFMVFSKTYLWTPDTSVSFIKNSQGSADVMEQGTIYGGLPYITNGTGSPYRMMDYINPETGLLDMHKALPALGTKDQLSVEDMRYFGSQCSFSTYWAWGRVINSVDYRWTSYMVPNKGFIFMGDITIPADLDNWKNDADYGTDDCAEENGEQKLFEAYALMQKADGLVTQTGSSGHTVMAYTDAEVTRNSDGTIDGKNSYIYVIDQAQGWKDGVNASGDTYKYKERIGTKRSFQYLFDNCYLPFTFKEFLGEDGIEVTTVSLKDKKSNTAYAEGTVDEITRLFAGTQSVNTLTWKELFSSTITSNYGIADAYIIFTDKYGVELYRHAVRVGTSGRMTLDLVETGKMVTVWETRELTAGKTYNVSVEVQLATGERPVIWEGTVVR